MDEIVGTVRVVAQMYRAGDPSVRTVLCTFWRMEFFCWESMIGMSSVSGERSGFESFR